MSYITLYRKYRPQKYDELIGQEHVTTTLKNAIDNDKVSHAYLFCGPRGTGKTTTARILAKAVNCKEGPTSVPCGKCSNCISITEGHSLDILEIDAASNRGIDEIRELREKVNFAPSNCLKKVYIIDEVHMLTTEASNALLKIMEEPPEHVIFILATTEPHKVLPTILSRCQRFDFKRVLNDDIAGLLKNIAKKEKIIIDEPCLNLISKQSQGSVRDAIGILDQLGSYNVKKIQEEDVLALLNIYEDDLLFDFCECIINRDTARALKLANQVIESGRDLRHFVNSLIEHFREIFLLITTEEAEKMIAKSEGAIERLKEQARQLKLFEALKALNLLSECSSEMRWSTDTRLLFEIILVKLTKLEADLSLEGLLYRIEELEKGSQESFGFAQDKARVKSQEKGNQESRLPAGMAKDNSQEKGSQESRVKSQESRSEEKTGEKVSKPKINTEKIERLWPVILEQVKKQSIPTYSLLLQCHPVSLKSEEITLEFNSGAEFHLKEVEKQSNRNIINKAIVQCLGKEYKLNCILGNGAKEDLKQSSFKPKNLPSEHVVKLMKDTFGAEIIEESSINDPPNGRKGKGD